MNGHPTIRSAAKTNNFSPSATQFRAAVQPKKEQEQPVQFDPVLAHEIRNPLSTINLAAQMLKSMIGDNYQKIYLDIIMRGAMRINEIITENLIPSPADELQCDKHSIHKLLDEVLDMTGDRIMLKNITVIKEYAARDCRMVLNRQKMIIALTNIIINAIDSMPTEKGQLKLVTKSVKGKWEVRIEDNGTGISKKNLKTIFKPYFTYKPEGMGLGLSTTLDILRSNHASTNVESEEGRGTCFILTFGKDVTVPEITVS